MKTIEDFKRQAKEKNITWWKIHNCSMCDYECGYVIKGDRLFYDSGCCCTSMGGGEEPRDWQDLPDHYNMQTNKKYIKEMNDFWGFTQ